MRGDVGPMAVCGSAACRRAKPRVSAALALVGPLERVRARAGEISQGAFFRGSLPCRQL